MESDKEIRAKDFRCYAAPFALTSGRQAQVDRRRRQDVERIAAKQAEAKIEAERVAKELEQQEKAKATQELMVSIAAKLKKQGCTQQGERVECQVLPVGQECGPPWSTKEELREIPRIYPHASGTVYVTHYAIGFTHKEMVHTPVLFGDAPGDTAKMELREHNPFALRSMVTSTATLPTQGQAGYHAECASIRAAGSLLNDSRRAKKVVLEGQVSAKTEPAESPMNDQSEAMPMGVQVGEDDRQSVSTRQHSV